MDKCEIIERLKNIAEHAVHTVGEEPFVMSLDDGIAVREAIELLEKPETNCSEIPNSSDTISRQQAIDEIHEDADWLASQGSDWQAERMERDKSILKSLPSTQSEIIYCKDCKHRDPEDKKCDCGHDIQWQLPRQDNWYCADAERREGKQDE